MWVSARFHVGLVRRLRATDPDFSRMISWSDHGDRSANEVSDLVGRR